MLSGLVNFLYSKYEFSFSPRQGSYGGFAICLVTRYSVGSSSEVNIQVVTSFPSFLLFTGLHQWEFFVWLLLSDNAQRCSRIYFPVP